MLQGTKGKLAEIKAVAKLLELGHQVFLPVTETSPCDLICVKNRIVKIQVKSAFSIRERQSANKSIFRYEINVSKKHHTESYKAEEIDYFILYLQPEDLWYIIPTSELLNTKQVKIGKAPTKRRGKFDKYQNAWSLLE